MSNIEHYDHKNSWKECSRRQAALREGCLQSGLFAHIDDRWHKAAAERNFTQLDEVKAIGGKLTPANYSQSLRTLIKMEEAHDQISRRKSDMLNQSLSSRINQDQNGNQVKNYCIKLEQISERRPKLIVGDFVIMCNLLNIYRVAKITAMGDDLVSISSEALDDTFLSSSLNIFFVSCGDIYRSQVRALDRLERDSILRSRLFDHHSRFSHQDKLELEPPINSSEIVCNLSEAQARLEQLNVQQRQAVLNIVDGSSWPKPYILFGPPGTGKTHTLAEAIGQIYTRKPGQKILFSANSNTCVDQMVEKLWDIDFISKGDIARLSAGDKTDGINKSRIILTTNTKCSCLMDEFEFDFVIVDEAGHAHEVETLLPICCLKLSGCLVLAGDPKLLGPIIMCEQAKANGLGISMLERLFDIRAYQREQGAGYDPSYITKLILNYKCDPEILAISNKLFYDNELKFINETPRRLMRMMHIDNPLQFCFVKGQDEKSNLSSSRFNNYEAIQIVDLVLRLYELGVRPDQIGVMSPYRLQVKLIHEKLRERLRSSHEFIEFLEHRFDTGLRSEAQIDQRAIMPSNKRPKLELSSPANQQKGGLSTRGNLTPIHERWLCEINTVDGYRAGDRDIIIISTVRTTRSGSVDFINDDRRFNKAISRANWLVFVFGNKEFLEDQNNWREFIEQAGQQISSRPTQSSADSGYLSQLLSC